MGIVLFARMLWGLSQSKALGELHTGSGKVPEKVPGEFWEGEGFGAGPGELRKDSSPSQVRMSQKVERDGKTNQEP